MIIRSAVPADFNDVARIWFESWATVGIAIAQDATVEELRARIPEDIAGGWDLYVAEEDGALRAMMALIKKDNHLDQLFVDPPHKGRGIGARLLNLAKAEMPNGMWLRTAKSNTPAIAFYERHGFVHDRDDVHPRLRYPVVYYRWYGQL